MKYNALKDYRSYLERSRRRAAATAKTYHDCISWLLRKQNITDCRKLNVEQVMKELQAIEYANKYSQHKNAFLYFCDFLNIKLNPKIKAELETMQDEKKKKKRSLKNSELENIKNKIRVMRDKKLKLSYNTMLASGLRVGELSQIKKEDSVLTDNTVTFHFTGKSGKDETVRLTKEKNQSLFSDLVMLIESTPENQKVFYSTSHLKSVANEKGFTCHDLRRAFAKIDYQENKCIDKVRKDLRHSKKQTTKLYLKSKIKI